VKKKEKEVKRFFFYPKKCELCEISSVITKKYIHQFNFKHMKKIFTLITALFVLSFASFAQEGTRQIKSLRKRYLSRTRSCSYKAVPLTPWVKPSLQT